MGLSIAQRAVLQHVEAVSAGNDFMQSAFSALCAKTNRLEQLHEHQAEPTRQPEGRFAQKS